MKALLCIVIFLSSFSIYAQKAGFILENGIHINKDDNIFIRYDGTVIKYAISNNLNDLNKTPKFLTLADSAVFLVSGDPGVNIYMLPLNPLIYSFGIETKVIADPVNAEVATVFNSIVNVLNTTVRPSNGPGAATTVFDTCSGFSKIESNLKMIQEKLKDDKKKEINDYFNRLRNLNFIVANATVDSIKIISQAVNLVNDYYNTTSNLIKDTQTIIDKYKCDKNGAFSTSYLFNVIIKDLNSTAIEQKKRLENLQLALKLVNDVKDKAILQPNGLSWSIDLGEIQVISRKIAISTISITKSGFELSSKAEIIKTKPKDELKKVIRVRKFQRFVPEVIGGVAFSFFKYQTYGTRTENGVQYVDYAKNETVRNVKFTAMVNFIRYAQDSDVHPFIQIGAGANTDIPTIFLGGGFRFNIDGIKSISISGGGAFTWIKILDKLNINDKVSGTAEIEKDLKYQFQWPPKPYAAIQYSF